MAMNRIIAAAAIGAAFFIAACGMFGPSEQVQQQSNKTVYRSTAENPIESPTVTPSPQKIPGETR
jgi:hypothetical protein